MRALTGEICLTVDPLIEEFFPEIHVSMVSLMHTSLRIEDVTNNIYPQDLVVSD